MAKKLVDVGREFKRFRHSAAEKLTLAGEGFQHVLSSNISAIATEGRDLVIRFHGGATYKYKDQAKNYQKMLSSNSKGKWVWSNLIRKNVSYSKTAGVSLPTDDKFKDKDLMESVEKVKERTPTATRLAQLGFMMNKSDLIGRGIIVNSIKDLMKI